jgi:CPA2 family monovalent cation:H+ antiporter-2
VIEVAGEFATIALISAIAFVSPIIAERVKIPAVVLEIVLGMVFGISFLNIIQESEWLSFLSLFGLIFLMFLAGLEIEVENVLRSGNLKQIVAFFALSLSLAVVFVVMMGFDLFYAIILTNVAVGVVVSVLREVGLEKENFGQINIVTALVSDFSTMFLLSIYFLTGLLQIAFALMIILVFYVAYRFGKLAIWYFPEFISRWFSDEPSEIGVRGSLAIMILFVGLSSLLGVEAILGAFLAGVLLSITFRGGRKLYDKLYGMGFGFFIPIFFIKTGSELNIFQGIERIELVIILLLASMLVKIVPSLVFSPVFGVRKAISMGALQSTKLSLTVAGVAIAMTAGIITEIEATALVTFTIVSCLLSPTLFRYLYRPSFLPNTR